MTARLAVDALNIAVMMRVDVAGCVVPSDQSVGAQHVWADKTWGRPPAVTIPSIYVGLDHPAAPGFRTDEFLTGNRCDCF